MRVDTSRFSVLGMSSECAPLKISHLNCVLRAAEARARFACLDPVFPHNPRAHAGGR
jgi:hypothetical protein